ncbi:sialidase family protein [Niabella aquatica]
MPVFAQEDTAVPGIVITHVPASSQTYIGSPSICILPNGKYVASHDFFGPNSQEATNAKTEIFESADKGQSWKKIAELNQFWSGLFVHKSKLYLMGTRNGEGDCVIRRSADGGHTWTNPVDEKTGLLIPAREGIGYHTSSMPVLDAKGKLWRGMEEVKPGGPWGGFKAFVMSVKENRDLLYAKNWTVSNKLQMDKDLGKGAEWLEGNAVMDPDGNVVDILRVHYGPDTLAAMINISRNGKKAIFNPAAGFITLPGASKKFNIKKDPKLNKYWTLTNAVPEEYRSGYMERTRNTVCLLSSDDLVNWQQHGIILQGKNVAKHGFQYLDWQFDGDDLIAAVRTAYDDDFGGADNQHNANYLIFYRVKDFRSIR